MNLQLLISTVDTRDPTAFLDRMNISTEAIVINQCDSVGHRSIIWNNKKVDWFNFNERGIGLSRNNALMRADKDIVLFADEDCFYIDNLEKTVVREFEKRPDVDILLFNFDCKNANDRNPLTIVKEKKINKFNYMKYGAIHIAAKLKSIAKNRIYFSLLFGGGAKYSCGEDSIFLRDCLKAKLIVKTCPVTIGEVDFSVSSWSGKETETLLRDRGALNYQIAGKFHLGISLRYYLRNKRRIKQLSDIGLRNAMVLMNDGANEIRKYR